MSSTFRVVDYDIIYLSYDEPNAEKNYADLVSKCPWAEHVSGVKGSDSAHKAAAEKSTTDRFITVDADNIINDDFLNQVIDFDENTDLTNKVISWTAKNIINGLSYGNGGLKCWPKQHVLNMRTHENSDGSDDTAVEFCFDDKYWALHNCYSTTYPNQTAFQAWRAGFREGVKMCLDKGAKPALTDFEKKVHSRNFDNLQVWQNIGRDVDNGVWAIYGARLGTQMTMLTDWDFTKVQDFDELDKLWLEYKDKDPDEQSQEIGRLLQNRLGLPCANMSAEESKFFKHHMTGKHFNIKPMIREIDIIRIIEGW